MSKDFETEYLENELESPEDILPEDTEDEDAIAERRRLVRMLGAKKIADMRIIFATKYHRNTKGQPLNFDHRRYLVPIYADPSLDIVLRVPVQIGKTEWANCDTFAAAAMGLSVFQVTPKQELRSIHVAERVQKLIRQTPRYAELSRQKHGSKSTTLAHFGKGSIRFVGSRVESDMISFPADVIHIDELDRCDLANLSLADDRFEESEFKIIRRTSTPTIPGSESMQNIDYFYNDSDQKVWKVPCPSCGEYQEIRWDTHLVEVERDDDGRVVGANLRDKHWSPTKWKKRKLRIKLPCQSCGKPLNRLAKGKWIAKRPEIWYRSGYTMSRLIAVSSEVEKIYLTLEKSLGSPKHMQRTINSIFAEPYRGIGDRLDERMLDRATRIIPPYNSGPKERKNPASMGIDVNRPFFDVWISDYPLVYPDKVIRRTLLVAKVLKLSEVYDLIKRYNVRVAVIDAEPENRLSIDFVKEAPCEAWMAMYRQIEGGFAKDWLIDEKNHIITIDRTSALDSLYRHFQQELTALPMDYETFSRGRFTREMLDAVRVLDNKDGRERYVWAGNEAHALHASNYDYLAYRKAGFSPGGLMPPTISNGGLVKAKNPLKELQNEFDDATGRVGRRELSSIFRL